MIIKSNLNISMPVKIGYDKSPIHPDIGVIFAALVLIFFYSLLIWEVIEIAYHVNLFLLNPIFLQSSKVVHRTFAAMLASTLSIGILASLNDRPTVDEIVKWIDVETLLLLFSMMILVGILTETGIFDYLAVFAYKVYIFKFVSFF